MEKEHDCGAGAETQAVFCSRCGRKIEPPCYPPVQPVPLAQAENQQEAPVSAAPPSPVSAPVLQGPGEKRCTACGTGWGPEFRFCPKCGDELVSAVPGMKLVIHSPDGGSAEIALDGSTIVIGTGPEASFRLKDLYASKKHCRFVPTAQGGYQVEDLGSSNGTFARLSSPAPVTPGSSFLLGTSLICVEQS